MPLPTPQKGEDREKFIGRCVSTISHSDELSKEFPEQDQRLGVCYTQFRKERGEAAAPEPKESLKLHLFSESINLDGNRVSGICIHPKKIFHPEEGLLHVFIREQLQKSASSLAGKSFGIDHRYLLPPPNTIDISKWSQEEDGVYFEGTVDDVVAQNIRDNVYKGISIELNWLKPGGSLEFVNGVAAKGYDLTSVHFLRRFPPGDKEAYVKLWEQVEPGTGLVGPPVAVPLDKRVEMLERGSEEFKQYVANEIDVIKSKVDTLIQLRGSLPPPQVAEPIGPRQLSLEEQLEWSLLKDRTMIFHGEVYEGLCEKASRRLEFLSQESKEPIHIILNSVGGNVFDGLLVYDTINKIVGSGIPVICEARGLAASMGSIILQAGSKRLATPHTRFLIHEASSMAWGKSSDVSEQAEELKKVNASLISIYAEKTGKSNRDIEEAMHKKDVWMSAQEALDFGLIDEVVQEGSPSFKTVTIFKENIEEYIKMKEQEEPKSESERAKNHFNISDEKWEELSDEEKQKYISELPPPGTKRDKEGEQEESKEEAPKEEKPETETTETEEEENKKEAKKENAMLRSKLKEAKDNLARVEREAFIVTKHAKDRHKKLFSTMKEAIPPPSIWKSWSMGPQIFVQEIQKILRSHESDDAK